MSTKYLLKKRRNAGNNGESGSCDFYTVVHLCFLFTLHFNFTAKLVKKNTVSFDVFTQ